MHSAVYDLDHVRYSQERLYLALISTMILSIPTISGSRPAL